MDESQKQRWMKKQVEQEHMMPFTYSLKTSEIEQYIIFGYIRIIVGGKSKNDSTKVIQDSIYFCKGEWAWKKARGILK